MLRACLSALLLAGCAAPALAQSPPPPPIRRWVDLQHVHLSSRYRWIESNTGRITSSTHQWQPQVRARFPVDPPGRFSIHLGAFGGSQFGSGWNNTGAGLGRYSGDFHVKQLFAAVAPRPDLELQVGGLYLARGENTEITSYDNDGYIVGERLTWRRATGRIAQVVATAGYIGDFRTPNVFRRLDRLNDWNYAQLLVGVRLSPLVALSADYTYEDTRDIVREGVSIRMPRGVKLLTAVKLEAYQRIVEAQGFGFNLSGDLRLTPRLSVTAGVAHVDRGYVAPGFGSLNADRFERGSRFYSAGSYALTRDVSLGWFHNEAFGVDYAIPNERRWEAIVTINPTATLKARRIF